MNTYTVVVREQMAAEFAVSAESSEEAKMLAEQNFHALRDGWKAAGGIKSDGYAVKVLGADITSEVRAVQPQRAADDPRVVVSRERLHAIPSWRWIKLWRATGPHRRLLNEVIAERIQERRR